MLLSMKLLVKVAGKSSNMTVEKTTKRSILSFI